MQKMRHRPEADINIGSQAKMNLPLSPVSWRHRLDTICEGGAKPETESVEGSERLPVSFTQLWDADETKVGARREKVIRPLRESYCSLSTGKRSSAEDGASTILSRLWA